MLPPFHHQGNRGPDGPHHVLSLHTLSGAQCFVHCPGAEAGGQGKAGQPLGMARVVVATPGATLGELGEKGLPACMRKRGAMGAERRGFHPQSLPLKLNQEPQAVK